MKKLLAAALLFMGIHSAYSKEIKYECSNKKIDENASYYLPKYFVNLNTTTGKASFFDVDGNDAGDNEVTLEKFKTKDARLVDALKGTLWSDGGCEVEVYVTKEMLAGEKKAFLKAKQELECIGSAVWLVCSKI